MKLKKLALAALVVVTTILSGCVVVPPRAYIASPPVVYVHPWGYDHHRHYDDR